LVAHGIKVSKYYHIQYFVYCPAGFDAGLRSCPNSEARVAHINVCIAESLAQTSVFSRRFQGGGWFLFPLIGNATLWIIFFVVGD
jgi:hypothetical protein